MEVGNSDVYTTLAEAWNGAVWKVTTPQGQGEPMNLQQLNAISCASAKSCLAVGTDSGCCADFAGIAFAWDGSSWTYFDGTSQVSLSGVSCTKVASCLVVGTQGGSDTQPLPTSAVVEKWDGTALTELEVDPVGQQSGLNAVSCSNTNWCAGVGSYTTGSGVTYPLVERWNGRTLNRV